MQWAQHGPREDATRWDEEGAHPMVMKRLVEIVGRDREMQKDNMVSRKSVGARIRGGRELLGGRRVWPSVRLEEG